MFTDEYILWNRSKSQTNRWVGSMQSDSKLKRPSKEFELSKNLSYSRIILGNSRDQEKVRGINDFELIKLAKFDCILI